MCNVDTKLHLKNVSFYRILFKNQCHRRSRIYFNKLDEYFWTDVEFGVRVILQYCRKLPSKLTLQQCLARLRPLCVRISRTCERSGWSTTWESSSSMSGYPDLRCSETLNSREVSFRLDVWQAVIENVSLSRDSDQTLLIKEKTIWNIKRSVSSLVFFFFLNVSYLSGVVIWSGVGWWHWGHMTFIFLKIA